MAAPGWRSAFSRSRSALALGVSIVLHALIAYAVSRVPWSVSERDRAVVANVVWLTRAPPAPPLPVEPPAEAIPFETEEPPEAEPAQPSAGTAEAAEPPEVTELPVPEGDRRRRNYLAPGVDWEEERRRAVAKALEDLEREQQYSSFSTEGFGGDEQADEAPNPREDLFRGATPGGRAASRSVLQPGRSRSAFLNRMAEICNALTGGGLGLAFQGMFIGTACTEPGPTADFFADLRPDYMDSLPECEEADLATLSPLALERRDEIPTIKCRLVPKVE